MTVPLSNVKIEYHPCETRMQISIKYDLANMKGFCEN